MNEKRESKYVRFARLAYAIVRARVLRYTHPKSLQRFTQPQFVVCLLYSQYLNGLFGKCWECETMHSVIKRPFGDVIRSRSWRLQRCESMLKTFVYNLHR